MSLSKEEIDDGAEVALAIHASGRDAAHAKFIRLLDALKNARAQLAESAAREVQLRTELTNTRASIQSLIVEAKTPRGISSHTVITFGGVMIGDIDRALAAPPSTAAAELVALRGLEPILRTAVRWLNMIKADTPNDLKLRINVPINEIEDALAVVAAARAGTP